LQIKIVDMVPNGTLVVMVPGITTLRMQ